MKKLMSVFAVALTAAAGACGGCGSPSKAKGGGGPPHARTFAPVKVVTFNAGLGPGMVRHATVRTPLVAEALGALDYGVLCLQEVWTPDARQRAIDALALPPENVYTVDTAGTHEDPADTCTEAQLTPALDCVSGACPDIAPEDTAFCALEHCQLQLYALYMQSPHCLTCVIASTGKDAAGIWDACTKGHASRIQGGNNGVILASKWPLGNRHALHLNASGANRVVLFATVERPDGPWFDVACTHLSAGQQIPPMQSGYASWDEERAAELDAVNAEIDARTTMLPMVFAGDMNFGGAHGDVVASGGGVWDQAVSLGFVSPAHDQEPPLCSICAENTFHDAATTGKLIDHVLFLSRDGDLVRPDGAERVLDAPVNALDLYGRPLTTSLSDHFGIRVTLDVAEPL